MKEQRQAIKAAEVVDANLGEIQETQSRFIDAGFVNTGGRDVDWAGKFLNAAKAGVDAYHSTDNYQQKLRDQKTQALSSATNYINDTELRAEAEGVTAENMSYFLMKEMENAVAQLGADDRPDDSLSRAYKDAFLGAITTKYNSMALKAQSDARGAVRQQKTLETYENVKNWDYSFEETQEDLKTYFSDSQISSIWAKAKVGQLAKTANEFEGEYNSYLKMSGDMIKDINDEIKASGKTRKEWLLDRDDFESAEEYTMEDEVEARLIKLGIENPLDTVDKIIENSLTQQGTDGVGAIAELNTTEGKALFKAVKTAQAKIKGVKYSKEILGAIALGVGDVSSMLDTRLTGVDSEDENLKEKVKSGLIQQTALWFQTSMTDSDPIVRQDAAKKLSDFLIRNPDYQAATLTPIANGFASRWKTALDETDPSEAMVMLSDMSTTLWSTDTGSATRELLLKASGANFELAMKAYRVGILPEHIIEMSRGNLPKVTQEEYKSKFGEDSYAAVKAKYNNLAREHMPWASPKEVADITKFAMDFDYFEVGFDDTEFFEMYGEGMSHRAAAPATEMKAGESHPITDFFGGKIYVPKSGAWKYVNAQDVKTAGYTQGMLHHLFANSNPELTQEIIKGLGMELEAKSYSKDGKPGEYFTLNYSEGITDDFQPIRIRRYGQNEWKIELTTQEWLDGVPIVGDAPPHVGITISNEELIQASARFDKHLENIAGAEKVVSDEEKERKDKFWRKGQEDERGLIPRLKKWFKLPDTMPWDEPIVVEDESGTITPIQ